MSDLTLHIDDMHCGSCATKICDLLAVFDAISDVNINLVHKNVLISHNGSLATNRVLAQIEDAGFHPAITKDADVSDRATRALFLRLGISGLALMQIMMAQGAIYAGLLQGMDPEIHRLLEFTALVFCIPVVSYAAMPFFTSGLNVFSGGSAGINMNTPIAIAILIAFCTSLHSTVFGSGDIYYDSVAMFTFLMLGARYVDSRLRLRLGDGTGLLSSLPKTTTRVVDGLREKVPVANLKPADVVWVKEGDQIPADGVLLDDACTIDEALLTGETDWHERYRNQQLFAGTFNRGAGFRMLVTETLQHTRLAEIENLSSQALARKHRLAGLADNLARVFIPAILAISALTGLAWLCLNPDRALSASLAVLIVSCPCALSLAIPTAFSAAMARLRQQGVVIKNTKALEAAYKVGHIIFDKTGTLASPVLSVRGIHNLSDHTTRWCIDAASAIQLHSSHPLASAFERETPLSATGVKATAGKGLCGIVDGHKVRIGSSDYCNMDHLQRPGPGRQVYLNIDGKPAVVFDLIETPRVDAAETIARLTAQGLKLELLSGDKASNCRRLAEPLRLPFVAGRSPEQKFEHLRHAKTDAHNSNCSLMYVGDGINDIPALALADLSVATLETNDLVKSKADVVLLTQRLSALIDLLNIGKITTKLVRQNLLWALGYNLIAIPWAATGTLAPWAAAIGMSLSSIVVLLNSSRLLRAGCRPEPSNI